MSIFQTLFYGYYEIELLVTSKSGMHLRPSAKLSSKAKNFLSKITIQYKYKEVNIKELTEIVSLSLAKGDRFMLKAQGKDAKEAIDLLEKLFYDLMEEEEPISVKKDTSIYSSPSITGDVVARGVATALAFNYMTKERTFKVDTDFKKALNDAIDKLGSVEGAGSDIYLAQKELLIGMGDKVSTLEELEQFIEVVADELKEGVNESKIADYEDILLRIKKNLGLEVIVDFPDTPFVLFADDMLPSQVEGLLETAIEGVVLKDTSISSHTALLLRAFGITSLVGVDVDMRDDSIVILDTYAGVLLVSPTEEDMKIATSVEQGHLKDKVFWEGKKFEKSITSKGQIIEVFANISDLKSATLAKESGAEGIGLLRTEFMFGMKKPSIKKQEEVYGLIFDMFEDITIRTLDIGGDKPLPYVDIPLEANPFLGLRGIRLFKTHIKLFEEQMSAILLASDGRKIKIMFPMISRVEEFEEVKEFVQNIAIRYSIDTSNIQFGIMIEVPSVLYLIDKFNKVVDFYSIGTNDLLQYLFAIDRTHSLLKVDMLSPVIFEVISKIVKESTKPVSICGELASNPKAVKHLIDAGLRKLSLSVDSIPEIKERIRDV